MPNLLLGQSQVIALDSSSIEHREFDSEKISKYQKQRAYNYDNNPKYEQNVFRRLWYNFWQKVRERLGEETLSTTWQIIQYLLILIAFALLLNFMLKSSKTSMFKKGDTSPDFDKKIMESQSGEESIQNMILAAEKEEDYSNAIRYLFLKVLKKLNEEDLIKWKDFKTNSQYAKEIKVPEISNEFEDLSHVFEYVVYGEFELEKGKYLQYKNEFESLYDKLEMVKV